MPRHDEIDLTVAGGTASIHYWTYHADAARGPSNAPRTIVMIHGFRGDHHGMQLIAEALSGRRVVVPDLPGFGLSEPWPGGHHLDGFTDFLHTFLRRLDLPAPPVIVGHSFGSIICAEFAARYPALLEELVLINPISAPALSGPRRLATKVTLGYYRAAAALPDRLGLRLLRSPTIVRMMSMAMAKTREPNLRRYIHSQHDAHFSSFTDRRALLETFSTSVRHTAADRAGDIRAPTLIIAGGRDDISTSADQECLAGSIPRAELTVVGRAGHLIHYEAPALAAAVIEEFLA